jgi:uncharacterized protein YneR
VELGSVERYARYGGTVSGMDGLVVHGFVVGIAIQLCIEREEFVRNRVVLVTFNVGERDLT